MIILTIFIVPFLVLALFGVVVIIASNGTTSTRYDSRSDRHTT